MTNYYNESDPFAADWLRELIKLGELPSGIVDERSITDVAPGDLEGFAQCHFFAGIGGWPLALRMAEWPDDRPIWTGSPPCQPFSQAGNRKGKDDERHLWPNFFNLIRQCRPPVIFGEQVASAIRHGWWDDLQADLESEDYACGMAVLPACSIGAPHKRERLFFFANSCDQGLQRYGRPEQVDDSQRRADQDGLCAKGSILDGGLVNSDSSRRQSRREAAASTRHRHPAYATGGSVAAVYCRDGKRRPVPAEPLFQPELLDGLPDNVVSISNEYSETLKGYPLTGEKIPNRVGIIKGAGNAIVPQLAAEFIKALTL